MGRRVLDVWLLGWFYGRIGKFVLLRKEDAHSSKNLEKLKTRLPLCSTGQNLSFSRKNYLEKLRKNDYIPLKFGD